MKTDKEKDIYIAELQDKLIELENIITTQKVEIFGYVAYNDNLLTTIEKMKIDFQNDLIAATSFKAKLKKYFGKFQNIFCL